jgi:hypothetical protein
MLDNLKTKFVLPTDEDYIGTIDGLLRLEDTYLLEPDQIRMGKLSDKYPSRPLTGR